MEGSVRQAGSQLRIAAQLVDTNSGAHLWAETYNRALQPDAIFDLQDELVPRIVSTVADMNGVLRRSMSDAMRGRRPDQLSPREAVLRGFGYNDRVTPEEHAEATQATGRAVAPSSSARAAQSPSSGLVLVRRVFNGYRQGDYQAALDAALKVNMPRYFFAHAGLAAAYGQLGQTAAARAALAELFAIKPDAAMEREYGKWFDAPLVEHLMDGLRKAGLDFPSRST
jgi:tetratricopeptide (TPR) repeat protein